MNDMQALAAATAAIPRIAQEEGKSERDVARRYFDREEEFTAFNAHLNRGIRGGLYDRTRARQAAMSTEGAEKEIQKYRDSPEGTRQRQEAGIDRAKLERASKYENLTAQRREGAQAVVSAGEVEEPENFAAAIVTERGAQYGQGNRFEQETERVTLRNITEGLKRSTEGSEWLAKNGPLKLDSSPTVKAEAANLLDASVAKRRSGPRRACRPKRQTAGKFQGRAREIVADMAGRSKRKLTPEQTDEQANALMAQAGRMTNPEFAMPQRRVITPKFDPMALGPGMTLQQPKRLQDPGEQGRDVAERLAAQPNADQVMKNLNEAAKNLEKASKPKVPPAHPGRCRSCGDESIAR